MEYEKLYAQMVEAAEQAIAAIERADYGRQADPDQRRAALRSRVSGNGGNAQSLSARQDALALRQFSANSYAPNAFPAGAFSVSKKSDHDRYRSAS